MKRQLLEWQLYAGIICTCTRQSVVDAIAAISPDGTSIAFPTYRRDIYTVPVNLRQSCTDYNQCSTTLIRYGAPMENKSHLLPTAWAVWIYSWCRQRGRHPKKINHSLRQRNTRSIQGCRPYPVSGKCNAVSRRCPISIRTIP